MKPESRFLPDFSQIKNLIVGDKAKTTGLSGELADSHQAGREMIENASFGVEIIDYPEIVEDICQEFEIKMVLSNLGGTVLNFEDIKNGDYFINLICEELEPERGYINTVLFDNGAEINDFGTLNPGETAEITYMAVNRIEAIDKNGEAIDTFFENPFNIVEENGAYTLRVEIGAYNEENENVVLGKSAPFPVEVEVMFAPGLFKACH